MPTETELLNTIGIKHCKEIKAVTSPLAKIELYHFSFCRIFMDGTKIYLTSCPEWMVYAYTKLYDTLQTNRTMDCYTAGFQPWQGVLSPAILQTLKKEFDVDQGMTFIVKQSNSCDLFLFASTCDKEQVHRYYLNNSLQLKLFCWSFLEEAKTMIQKCHADRLILPKSLSNHHIANAPQLNVDLPNSMLTAAQLSLQENICLQHFITGKTVKEIAKILALSPRTVETYITRAKLKLSASNSNSLSAKFVLEALLN